MPQAQHHSPFDLLYELDRQSRASAPGLPQPTETARIWAGLGFRVGELRLVVDLTEVREVVPYPAITPVPGTKRWLRGIANVRGSLWTVVDLADFLGKEPVQPAARCGLLTMSVGDLDSALLVHEVLGLRHFDEDRERRGVSDWKMPKGEPVRAYLKGAFSREGTFWGLFDMRALAGSEAFRHVAA